jgi:hypothetical protein
VCYGNDLFRGGSLPTSVFISSNIIKALGFMVPPTFKHMYCDNFWYNLGHELGCLKYFPDIIIEHMHHGNNKANMDSQYKRTEGYLAEDGKAYLDYNENQFSKDIQKVKDYLKNK